MKGVKNPLLCFPTTLNSVASFVLSVEEIYYHKSRIQRQIYPARQENNLLYVELAAEQLIQERSYQQ